MKGKYAIVGMHHRGTFDMVAAMPPGERLTLKREPENKYDGYAVQVWARGVHVGYLKANQVRPIAIAMDREIEARASAFDAYTIAGKLLNERGWPLVEVE